MHSWDDDWFHEHGDEFGKAQDWIYAELYRRTWCRLSYKEKWGTMRYEYVVPPGGAPYKLRWAIYAPWKVRNKTYNTTYRPILFAWNNCRLYYKWKAWAWRKLWVIVQEAVVKWPQFKDELYEDIVSDEDLVGKEIHSQYWSTYNGDGGI